MALEEVEPGGGADRQTDGLCSSMKKAPAPAPGSSGWQATGTTRFVRSGSQRPCGAPQAVPTSNVSVRLYHGLSGSPQSPGGRDGGQGPFSTPACFLPPITHRCPGGTGSLSCLRVPQHLTPAGLQASCPASSSTHPSGSWEGGGEPWLDSQILPQIPTSSPALLLGLEFPTWRCFRVNVVNKTGVCDKVVYFGTYNLLLASGVIAFNLKMRILLPWISLRQ